MKYFLRSEKKVGLTLIIIWWTMTKYKAKLYKSTLVGIFKLLNSYFNKLFIKFNILKEITNF